MLLAKNKNFCNNNKHDCNADDMNNVRAARLKFEKKLEK